MSKYKPLVFELDRIKQKIKNNDFEKLSTDDTERLVNSCISLNDYELWKRIKINVNHDRVKSFRITFNNVIDDLNVKYIVEGLLFDTVDEIIIPYYDIYVNDSLFSMNTDVIKGGINEG